MLLIQTRSFHLTRSLILAAALVTTSFPLGGTDLRGVLYSEEQGISAAGAGSIRLATAEGIFNLSYIKPLRSNFANSACANMGALWTASVKLTQPGQGTLLEVTCAGAADTPVRSAWATATRYLDYAAEGRFQEAKEMRSAKWLSNHTSIDTAIDLSGYRQYGRGQCLMIDSIDDSSSILIDISQNCFPRYDGQLANIRLVMTKGRGPTYWSVDRILVFSVPRMITDDGRP